MTYLKADGQLHRLGGAWMAAVCLGLCPASVASEPAGGSGGVVVEEVKRESALEKAGLRAGDRILTWTRLDPPTPDTEVPTGALSSPFDWQRLEIEHAPRGAVELVVERGGERVRLTAHPGIWEARVRPSLSETELLAYDQGKADDDEGNLEGGGDRWRELLAAAPGRGDLQCWILLRIAEALTKHQEWVRANEAYEEAIDRAAAPYAEAMALEDAAMAFRRQNRWDESEKAFGSASKIELSHWGRSLTYARNRFDLAELFRMRGDLDRAEEVTREALSIRESLAPDSLVVAESRLNLGAVAWNRQDFDTAERHFREALSIFRRLAPDSLGATILTNNLGVLYVNRGYLTKAQEYLSRARIGFEKWDPRGINLAQTYANLGALRTAAGQLSEGQAMFRQSLKIFDVLDAGGLNVAVVTNNLGHLAMQPRQLDLARKRHPPAPAIYGALAPKSVQVAVTWNNLGSIALQQGDLESANEYLQKAEAAFQKLNDESIRHAGIQANLGRLARLQQNMDAADLYYARAQELYESLAPQSLGLATVLTRRGLLYQDLERFGEAAVFHRRALEIRRSLAPDSVEIAIDEQSLGVIEDKNGRAGEANQHMLAAAAALESQLASLGGTQSAQAAFQQRYRSIYRLQIEMLLDRGEVAEAFHVLERSRAQGLLRMLAERDLIFSADIPADLGEAQRALAAEHDRIMKGLASLHATQDREKIRPLHDRLEDLRQQRALNVAEIRRRAPALAALRYPQPLTLAEAQQILDSGTLMLSYSVGESRTDLFAVTRDSHRVETLPMAGETLRGLVASFRQGAGEGPATASLENLRESQVRRDAARLYDLLIKPVSTMVETAERVLIVPDGPLHALPFGALVREPGGGSRERPAWQYLVEQKPLHSIQSATVYSELQKATSGRPATDAAAKKQTRLAAFGDPLYPAKLIAGQADAIPDLNLRSAVSRDLFDWKPLPYSRREVDDVARLYPSESARIYLGEEATEEAAKALDRSTRIVHFAVHGYLDDRFPLSSGLAFTIPAGFPADRENGLLQAWEIFEEVRLDADLVVLSACDSARGQQLGGEGVLGLTRAFQYAGARSILASLWSIDDQLTSELMRRFYSHLRAGKSKDAALRAAQLELIRSPIRIRAEDGNSVARDASSPYFWAAFQLIGDWQ